MSAPVDEPIGYDLTQAGWAAARAAEAAVSTLRVPEAADLLQVAEGHVCRLAQRGLVDAVKVDGVWLLDGGSVEEYRRRTPRPVRSAGPRRPVERRRRLPAGPLLRQVELRGGKAAVGARRTTAERRLLERAEASGYMSLWAADRLAVELLGLTLWELWTAEDLA